jgi:hypothetical protein
MQIPSMLRSGLRAIRHCLPRAARKRPVKWSDIEYFDADWKKRIAVMAGMIPAGATVLDLGCGMEWLKDYLPEGSGYVGVDYVRRSQATIICDFNRREFPDGRADVAFVSGCLEYIEDVPWFVSEISEHADSCILSYCTAEKFRRREPGWRNSYTHQGIVELFKVVGLPLRGTSSYGLSSIFFFSRK